MWYLRVSSGERQAAIPKTYKELRLQRHLALVHQIALVFAIDLLKIFKYLRFLVNIAERSWTWKHSFTIICSCRLFACIAYTSSQTELRNKIYRRLLWKGFFPIQSCDWKTLSFPWGMWTSKQVRACLRPRDYASDRNVNNLERTKISRTLTFLTLTMMFSWPQRIQRMFSILEPYMKHL